jgi:hypothetical protein
MSEQAQATHNFTNSRHNRSNMDVFGEYRQQQLERWLETLNAICTQFADLKLPDPGTGKLREATPDEKTRLIHKAWGEAFPKTPGR